MANNRIQISDQYYLELKINDEPVYLNAADIELYITQSVMAKLPTIKIIFLSEPTGRIINFFQAGDGGVVEVEMGREDSETERTIVSTWRMYGSPQFYQGHGGYRTTIIGLLAAPRYLSSLVNKSYNKNASAVIEDIIGELSLLDTNYREENTVDNSNDAQAWRATGKKYADFVKHLSDYARSGIDSCFMTALDEERVLYFRNITDLLGKEPKGKFLQSITGSGESEGEDSIEKYYPIISHAIKSTAGFLNNSMGYSFTAGQERIDGSFNSINSAETVRQTDSFDMSSEVRGELTNSSFEYRPIDCGNNYSDSEQAHYQNQRLRSLYSTRLDVLTEMMTDEDLLSLVEVELVDPVAREISTMYSGNYIVAGKTRCIYGSRYYEKFMLLSQGKNEDDEDRLY